MGAKENLNEAMFSMFGVGKAPAVEKSVEETRPVSVEPVVKKEVNSQAAKPVAASAPAPAPAPVTYLAPGSYMEGKLKCQGDLNSAGIFKGDIEAEGKVTMCANVTGNIMAKNLYITDCRLIGDVNVSGTVELDEKAVVEGKISAGTLICAGHVKGDLVIKGNIALKAHSSVEGNIVTGTMSMEAGAFINGSLIMKSVAAEQAESQKK